MQPCIHGRMSVNVQFREDEDTVAYVESKGIKPSALAKEAFEKEVRRLRAKDHEEFLKNLKLKAQSGDATRAVREMREER